MIEIDNDGLRISFPKVAAELRKLTHEYSEKTLKRILEEDRDAAFEKVLAGDHRFGSASEEERVALRAFVHQLTGEEIAKAFQQKVRANSRVDSPWNPGQMTINFQRTLRIPDDGTNYFLPPGLGSFPLRHIDDFTDRAPASWVDRGGVVMPMYQSEALWLRFEGDYPFALKIASGKINAVTGEEWRSGLNREPQDYLVVPEQPWLDGFAVEKGVIRQFVAMPLGAGYSVEEQITGQSEFGGIQVQACPMKASVNFRKKVLPNLPKRLAQLLPDLMPAPKNDYRVPRCFRSPGRSMSPDMGLGAGGRMKQEIYEDPNDLDVWDSDNTGRCFVHLCNALVWREITGTNPPPPPVTAKEYKEHGLPWFDFYRDDIAVLKGSKKLAGVKSVVALSKEKDDQAIIGNDSVETGDPVDCGPQKRLNQVREWTGK